MPKSYYNFEKRFPTLNDANRLLHDGDKKIGLRVFIYDENAWYYWDDRIKDLRVENSVNAGTGGVSVIEIEYNDLLELISNEELSTGSFYKITDFRTCYDQPDYDQNGSPLTSNTFRQGPIDPIIVFATSPNTLSNEAYQPSYPNDKIKYDINWRYTEISDYETYGRITERIDEFNNRTDYDHRTIFFKRYRTYFYDLNNPLPGTISINNNEVTGIDTNFTSLSLGSYIHVNSYDFKITNINNDTSMLIEGINLINDSNLLYYSSSPELDGNSSNIEYTHSQMIEDYNGDIPLEKFKKDGRVTSGSSFFGPNSKYFTNLYPGLFVMSAYNTSIDEFTIQGGLGADNSGVVNSFIMTIGDYMIYVKTVGGTNDPSVNHIVIMNPETPNNIIRNFSTQVDQDLDSFIGLSNNVTQIHYLLIAKPEGIVLTEEEVSDISDSYLSLIDLYAIEDTLSSLNENYNNITSLITPIYLFDDKGFNYINDGGNDMYDNGNYISTELSQTWKCYDYKMNNIIDDTLYREFKTFQFDKEILSNNNIKTRNNYIGNHSNFRNSGLSMSYFPLANNVFGMFCYSNYLGDRCYNNTTYNWFNKNKISGTFQKNTIKRGFYSNNIGEYFTDNLTNYFNNNNIGDNFNNNIINNDFYDNQIMNGFEDNLIASTFYNNQIMNYFENNYLYDDFYMNYIMNNFSDNNLKGEFYSNKIGEAFQNNILGSNISYQNFYDNNISNGFKGNNIQGSFNTNIININFVSNILDGSFSYNIFGSYCFFNTIGDSFVNNIIGNNFYGNTIGIDSNNNVIGNNFSGNNMGTDFNNNKICDNFQGNIAVNNFKYNIFETPSANTDYTLATYVYQVLTKKIILGSDSFLYLNYFDGSVNQFVGITD